jgi:hypothetical protein
MSTKKSQINNYLKELIKIFSQEKDLSMDDYTKYNEIMAEILILVDNIENLKKYIKLEPPEPSDEFVVKITNMLYTIFNHNRFSEICYKMSPEVVNKAIKNHFISVSYRLEKNTLIIFGKGWDTSAGDQYLKSDGYMLWEIFKQVADDLNIGISDFKYGRESYEKYVKRASNNIITSEDN